VRFIDGKAVIEGKHVEEDKFGIIERQFSRKISLPSGVTMADVRCEFSNEGILRIIAKKPSKAGSETSDSIAILDAE
jgi:HSP20 family molecular chaperone IbpA